MTNSKITHDDPGEMSDPHLLDQVAEEKLAYMHKFAKSSTVATILAPILCVPLYIDATEAILFNTWFVLMALAVSIRIFLVHSIDLAGDKTRNFKLLNWAVGIVTLMWGMGWLILVPSMDPVNYLIYQIISLTVLFVGMVGYCVHWRTFFSFVLPLKIPEVFFTIIYYNFIVWPIALGSLVAFYLALKMGYLFSQSWERSISLRFRNETLFNDLVIEKDASVAANAAKSDFIATASHDLRQPMQAINIFIEMINLNQLKEKEAGIFKKMRASIGVLNHMFNTLLDISKLDANFDYVENFFDLNSFVQDIQISFGQLAEDKGLLLRFEYQNCMVLGDAGLMGQVLRNLLSNAIQYTSEGQVTVRFWQENRKFIFSVEDTGCGIPAEDLPFVYKEFFRSEHSRSHYDGLGLGLTIVSRVIDRIGGTISVESFVSKGSIFTIRTNSQVTEEKLAIENHQAKLPIHQGGAQQSNADPFALSNTTHLGLIENDRALLDAYSQYFTAAGYTVHLIPHTEAEFNEMLLNLPKLDFILSDYRLGNKDGAYFIKRLREEFNDNIPACILTADTSPNNLSKFKELEIEVLYKPIDVSSIGRFVSSHVGPGIA